LQYFLHRRRFPFAVKNWRLGNRGPLTMKLSADRRTESAIPADTRQKPAKNAAFFSFRI
jgi:hypothetical protein